MSIEHSRGMWIDIDNHPLLPLEVAVHPRVRHFGQSVVRSDLISWYLTFHLNKLQIFFCCTSSLSPRCPEGLKFSIDIPEVCLPPERRVCVLTLLSPRGLHNASRPLLLRRPNTPQLRLRMSSKGHTKKE